MNAKRTLVIATIIAAIGFGLYWALIGRFNPTVPSPDYPPAKDRVQAISQDLDYLQALLRLDRSFSDEAARAFEHGRQALLARAETLTTAQFVLGVSELVALAGNGHTNVAPGARAGLMNRVPLRFAWFADGLFVVHSDRANAGLRAARIDTIGGRRPEDMLIDLKRFRGGRQEFARTRSMLLMESPEALASIYPELDPRQLPMALTLADGTRRDVIVGARAADPNAPNPLPWLYLSPVAAAEIVPDGVNALDADTPLPASLRGHGNSVHHEVLGDGVLYLHLWRMTDDEGGSLSGQLARLVSASEQPWKAVIVDLRFNGGGDYTKVHGFARDLRASIAHDGMIVVLVNNETFSAALTTVAWLKHYGGERTLIIGERLGDEPAFWAEGGTLTLPNSKLPIAFASGYHDWKHGCHDLRRCFGLNLWFGVAAGDLDPESETGWRFSDYMRGRDSVLEAALARIRTPGH